ncbi:MAG: cytidylate kinase-like family protein [Clostridiales bacterium]|nr:cytidylate kinase-like family protein [Candidatus Crickella caballi]
MDKIIVTIGREFGSGGHDVGKKLAERLGIKFYDQKLIDEAASKTGYDAQYIKEHEETIPHAFGSLFAGFDSFSSDPIEAIRSEQFQVLEDIIAEGSCVIVGRAADVVAADEPHVNIFLFAPVEDRIKRIKANMDVYKSKIRNGKLNENNIPQVLKTVDKNRRRFYEFYSDNKWGDRDAYDLLINTSRTGIEGAVSIIETYINECRGKDIVSDL